MRSPSFESYSSQKDKIIEILLEKYPHLEKNESLTEAVDIFLETGGTEKETDDEAMMKILLETYDAFLQKSPDPLLEKEDFKLPLNPKNLKSFYEDWKAVGGKKEDFEKILETQNEISEIVSILLESYPENKKSSPSSKKFSLFRPPLGK